MGKRMKIIAVIGLAIIIMLIPLTAVSCSCAEDDAAAIEKVINDMWEAYNQGEYARALTYINYDDGEEVVAHMKVMKNAMGDVTVQSIEDIYINGWRATANVTLYVAGQADTDEVKLIKKGGSWKIDMDEVDRYGSAQAERYTLQTAVTSAMFDVFIGELDAGGTVNSTVCNVTYNNGTPLPIGDYIAYGIASLKYEYSVDTEGTVHATSGPLAE